MQLIRYTLTPLPEPYILNQTPQPTCSQPSPWMAPFKLIGHHQHAEITPTHSVTSLCHARGNHPRTLLILLDSPPWLTVYTAVYPFSLHCVTTHAVTTRWPHTWDHCSSSWYKRRPSKPSCLDSNWNKFTRGFHPITWTLLSILT